MKFFWSKFFNTILAIGLVLGIGYYYKDSVSNFVQRLLNRVQPCERPITYSIGNVDPRFGVTNAELLADINKSVHIWDTAINRPLFAYSPAGDLKIILIYDSRQQATDALKSLGITINADKATYDALKAKYDSLTASYNQQKATIAALVATYNADKTAYEQQVNYWNSRGGAPPAEYAALQQKSADLNNQITAINQAERSLNALADTINSTVTIINKVVAELNAQGNAYNSVGGGSGTQFQEGEYVGNPGDGGTITIYQFDNQDKLVRVLAHELGHALGLQHIDNPKAIMYYLNEGINEKLTADDLSALKKACRIQ